MELNRNPENYFAEVEQAAFIPANVVPGIGFSPDKMLQARLVLLRRRAALPAGRQLQPDPGQRPEVPVHQLITATARCASTATMGRTPTYFPNSLDEWTDQPDFAEPPLQIAGAAAHWDHRVDDDYYQQPGDLFRKMSHSAPDIVRQHRPVSRRRGGLYSGTPRWPLLRPIPNMGPASRLRCGGCVPR